MNVSQEQFEKHLRERFGGKYTVATWEIVPTEDGRDEVIHVGLAKAELSLMEASDLPAEIDGVKVVYFYVGPIKALTQKYYEPLIGGISFGAIDITAGTLGGVVYDRVTDSPFLLTNEHVVSDTSNIDPDHPPLLWPILQPGPVDGGKKPAAGFLSQTGGLKEKALRGEPCNIDAALVTPERGFNAHKYWGMGDVEEFEHTEVQPGDRIIKSGRTTGVTSNTVASVGVSANIGGMSWSDPVVVENLIMTRSSFVEGGDSGSRVWKSETMEPVGLVFAGSWLTSLIIPAETICNKLNVYFGRKKWGGNEKVSWCLKFWRWLLNLIGR